MRAQLAPPAQPHEHEFEAQPGLPEALPANEQLLWQGRPDSWLLLQQVFHFKALLLYFGVLLTWRGVGLYDDGASLAEAVRGTVGVMPLALLALGLLATLAWLMASTTAYTLTNRRVVMRVGVVLSVTFNLPFARIAAADLRPLPGGAGDIALTLHAQDHIGYLHLWPHARPWQLRRPQPMLRAVPNAAQVTQRLAQALRRAEQARLQAPRPGQDLPVPAPADWHQPAQPATGAEARQGQGLSASAPANSR